MADETPAAPAPAPAAPAPAAVSPTGQAIIPPVVAKIMVPIAAVSGILVMEADDLGLGIPNTAMRWIKLAWIISCVLLGASPGARKKATAE